MYWHGRSSNKTISGNEAPFIRAGGNIQAGEDILLLEKVGVLNKGKHNTFINNSFEGLNVGIQDEGENTTAKGNKFN